MKQFALAFLFILMGNKHGTAQIQVSIASDASLMRNLSPKQEFWAFGQTIQGNFHFTRKETGYLWIAYYTPGKFKNTYTAFEKLVGTNPPQIPYTVSGRWLPRQVSLGWKHYFKGSFDADGSWNLYGIAGFGLMVSTVQNTFNTTIDTSVYNIPSSPVSGNGSFKRLTFDLGLGAEYPIGADIYLYGDIRTWLPASDNNPSPYFHNGKNVPLPLMINAGIRILFGDQFSQ